jgi:D-alanyl-lipoteichoic acid acyltransferase DltB (MBOAT superfamily)
VGASVFWIPLRSPGSDTRPADLYFLFFLNSGIALTLLRMYSHFYDRVTGRCRPIGLADYLAYMVYFPQFLSGPLERSRQFVARIRDARSRWSPADAGRGFARHALGWAALIAVPVAALPPEVWMPPELRAALGSAAVAILSWIPGLIGPLDPRRPISPFERPESFSTPQIVAMVHALPLLMYAWVSSAASVQLGVSRAFGIRGTENYRYPLISASPQEVWHRWNITMFAFLRDYIYAPLGGKRRKYLNIFVVFVYCGAMHGLQARGVAWGAYTGASVALSTWVSDRLAARRRPRSRRAGSAGGVVPGSALTVRSPSGAELHDPDPPRATPSGTARVAHFVAILLTFEWSSIGAVILADPDYCGVRLLGEYFRRIGGGLAAIIGLM